MFSTISFSSGFLTSFSRNLDSINKLLLSFGGINMRNKKVKSYHACVQYSYVNITTHALMNVIYTVQ